MSRVPRNPSGESLSSSSSSLQLSRAASASAVSRKSTSVHSSTTTDAAPRASFSISRPIPIPWSYYTQSQTSLSSRDVSAALLSPAHASLPENSTDRRSLDATTLADLKNPEDQSAQRRRSPRPQHGFDLRRASYSSQIFNQNRDSMSESGASLASPNPDPQFDGATTATSVITVSTGQSGGPGGVPSHSVAQPPPPTPSPAAGSNAAARRPSRSRNTHTRIVGGARLANASTSTERNASEDSKTDPRKPPLGILGVCALDAKARSKPSRNILNRINSKQEFDVIIFGDKVILDEEPENWPICDYLISFFSDGFPLDKAIAYTRLRKPFCVNDLPMQMVLWDRRLCLMILDRFKVPTPERIEVSRDGGPKLQNPELAKHILERTGLSLPGPADGTGGGAAAPSSVQMLDDDTLCVDGKTLKKPFVEKPVSGEDHNIRIYYSSEVGGGGRRLFRKVNNKSSEADDSLKTPRSITEPEGSYIYESFLSTQNHEDVKAYTVGPTFCHAETRKSPVVDGIVKRNTHGKEMRYVTSLTPEEAGIAARIAEAFGQRVCGFDMLRVANQSYVIDVNGWSFVKDNHDYYDRCSRILKDLFVEEKYRREGKQVPSLDGETAVQSESSTRASHGHFSQLKSILKSPSMSRLAGHHSANARAHGRASPDLVPGRLSAASTFERLPDTIIISSPISPADTLPPPAVTPVPLDISQPSGDSQSAPPEEAHVPLPATKAQWKLKGMVAVIRHADRTPKQKWKFTFHTKPFVDLLKGHREEVLLVGEPALASVMEAVQLALNEGVEDREKLKLLRTSLMKKGAWPGTKVQIKPMFRKKKAATAESKEDGAVATTEPKKEEHKHDSIPAPQEMERIQRQGSVTGVTLSREAAQQENLDIEKLQLIIKWGGEPTHSARYQAQELGENMRNDLLLMNRDAIDDLAVFSSSEKRVTTSAQIWTAAFLDQKEVPPEYVQIRKDLLDDSNAAKDEMDKVKKKLKGLLRKGNKAPPQFAWPENMPEPYLVARKVVELMKFHRNVMRENFSQLYGGAASSLAAAVKSPKPAPPNSTVSASMTQAQAVNSIQSRWCCGEDAELFKERWEKLFDEFCDPEKVDPSRISELHDTMKFDALHNRQFLEWVFTPSAAVLGDFTFTETGAKTPVEEPTESKPVRRDTAATISTVERSGERTNIAQLMGFRKRPSVDPAMVSKSINDAATESYFNLFTGNPRSKAKNDIRLEKLRELFFYSKILFDFIGPQEYGILDSEKLEIGLLTSLPLLRAIVSDLEDMQASEGAKSSVYFTKESHIYTLLNCIIEGGVQTKIERNKIPELDYLSMICFELYESPNDMLDENTDAFKYSIRITISPGCHTFEPLDVQLDSRHTIGFAQRRSLTAHNDWKAVIETLRAKFNAVKLPKSFVAVNLSEKVPDAFESPVELEKRLDIRQAGHGSDGANGGDEQIIPPIDIQS